MLVAGDEVAIHPPPYAEDRSPTMALLHRETLFGTKRVLPSSWPVWEGVKTKPGKE